MPEPVAARIEPLGEVVTVDPGESLLDAAWRAGLDWPTTCYGQAECGACRVEVVSGHVHVIPASDEERDALRTRIAPSQAGRNVRLACRITFARAAGDGSEVVVHKRGVRGPEP